MLFWYRLHLHGDVYLSTGPEAVAQGLRSLGPALQYLAGELPVEPGLVLPMVGRGLGLSGERVRTASAHRQLTPRSCALPAPSQVASHNTVRMRFDIESADYLHLHKPDASFPHRHYSMLADVGRCEVRAKLVSARSNPHAACVLHAPTGLHAPHQCRRTSAPLRARWLFCLVHAR